MASKVPSAIQIRLGGAKGVLCVNPLLKGRVIKLRKSMIKFDAPAHNQLEVAASSSHPLPTRLNRPLINALEDLGVEHDRFVKLQRLAVQDIDAALVSLKAASNVCRRYGFASSFGSLGVFSRLHDLLGCTPEQFSPDGMLYRLITSAMTAAMGDLKRKARIPTLGPTLIGVADEFGFLKKNEIFAQVEDHEGNLRIIRGDVLIGRSPTIHPGDTRMITAVVPPKSHPLHQLRNVIVFSCKGEGRSLPSMLGGGDLDGDIYSLYEEPLLFPDRNLSPGEYKQATDKQLNRRTTVEDLADFFTDYMINDQLGIVSHLHLFISDVSELHSFDPDCRKLAQLHSMAVDFVKTGQPVRRRDMPPVPPGLSRPDYLAQNDNLPGVYRSKRALGYLYREINWRSTDMPKGPTQLWTETDANGVPVVTTKESDYVMVLELLAKRHPYVRPPTPQDVVALGERYRPLLESFVYHLSRVAAWVPENQSTGDWLSEEEIVLGTPVMKTSSKLTRWLDKLQSVTSELVPILKHQLTAISCGSLPVAIQSSDRMDLDAQLQHRNFTTVPLAGTGAVELGTKGAPKARADPVEVNTGMLVGVEVDGERDHFAPDRKATEGEVVMPEDETGPGKRKEGSEEGEMQGLYSACMLGAQDTKTRKFGGDTFALVALSILLELVEAKQKRELEGQRLVR